MLVMTGVVALTTAGLLMTEYYPLAAAVGPALLFLALLFRLPWLGVFLVVLMVPFDAFREFQDPHAFLSVSKLSGILALGVSFVLITLGRIRFKLAFSNLWVFLLPFLVINAIAAMASSYPEAAFNGMRQLGIAFLVFSLTLLLLNDWKVLERLVDLIIISVALSALLSVAGYLMDIPALTMGLGEESLKRGIGGAKDPNVFASLIIFSLPLAAYRITNSGPMMARLPWIGFLALDLIAIVISQSRSGMLVAVLTLAFLAWEHRRMFTLQRLGVVMVLATIVIGGAAMTIPQNYWERQASLINDASDRSMDRRFSYLLVGRDSFLRSPVIGHGPGAYEELYAESRYAPGFITSKNTDLRRYAHNTYLEVLVGSGALGLLLFAGFLFKAIGNFAQASRLLERLDRARQASLSRALMWSLIVLMIFLLFISQVTVKYIWVAAGVSYVLLRLARNEAETAAEAKIAGGRNVEI